MHKYFNNNEEVVKDFYEFYTGPSMFRIKRIKLGSLENYEDAILIAWHEDEGSDEMEERVLQASELRAATLNALNSRSLCCTPDIIQYGVGHGCATDIYIITQFALFGEVIYG